MSPRERTIRILAMIAFAILFWVIYFHVRLGD
jgi:hypothetical protein